MSIVRRAIQGISALSLWTCPKYKIENAATIAPKDLLYLKNPFLTPLSFEHYCSQLLDEIRTSLISKQGYSAIRLGDGEAFFLRGDFKGNVISRHFSSLSAAEAANRDEWRRRLLGNDLLTFDVANYLREPWRFLFPQVKNEFFPINIIYGLIASRRLFRLFPSASFGIIGAAEKLSLISRLCLSQDYRDYLGVSQPFQVYVPIPQRHSCDRIDDLEHTVLSTVNQAPKCDIYLLGMGISKIYLMQPLRQETSSIVLDIGHGMDALAGIVPLSRSFMGDWTNYRYPGVNLENLDLLTERGIRKYNRVRYL